MGDASAAEAASRRSGDSGMMKIKVLLVCTGGIKNDGITSWAIQTYGAMDKTGLDLTAVAWEDSPEDAVERVESSGFTVVRLPNRKSHLREYLHSFDELLERGFDVVHACGSSSLLGIELSLAKRAGAEMRIAHSRNTVCSHRVANSLLRPLLYNASTDFYACGMDAGKWLFGKRGFTVIPNGKDPASFQFNYDKRQKMRKVLGINSGEIAIGHVGRVNEQKNQLFLFDVFESILRFRQGARLFLIGDDGGLMKEVQNKVVEQGLLDRVSFLGRRDDVPDLLNAMDCMSLPSLYEGFPNVVLEWQYNGLPCVISNAVTDECAVTSLVERVPLKKSPDDWAAAIIRKLADSDRANDSARATEALRAAGYDVYENAKILKHLYTQGVTRI